MSDVKTIPREKVTPRPVETEPGHWRNRWRIPKMHEHYARAQGALPLGDGTWLGYRKFPSTAEAESHAKQHVEYNWQHFRIRYIGTEFFTEY